MSIPKSQQRSEDAVCRACLCFHITRRSGYIQTHQCSPYKLHKLSKSKTWQECLKFWGYTGDPTLKGKRYKRKVAIKQVSESLKCANTLWRELFGLKKVSRKLERYLGE